MTENEICRPGLAPSQEPADPWADQASGPDQQVLPHQRRRTVALAGLKVRSLVLIPELDAPS
jgi:hypothetical protein